MATPAMSIHIDDLSDDEQSALNELLAQWRSKRARNNLRTAFYDMENAQDKLMSAQVPTVIRRRKFVLGWSAIAVDKLARRTNLDGFYDAGGVDLDGLGLSEWMRTTRLISEVSQAGTASLIHSCSFLVTTRGDESAGEPKALTLAVDAAMATGMWSRRSKSLTSFLSIHDLDNRGEPIAMSIYLPNLIIECAKDQGKWRIERRPHTDGVPVDPLRYKQRLDRPFGASRINRTVMSLHVQALAAMIRADVNGEAYSLPRYALMGATEDAFRNADGSPKPTWQAVWDAIWAIGDDPAMIRAGAPELARADIKQFNGQSPEPQNAHLRMLAQMFSGETGVPLGELGIIGDANPTSADALLVSRDDLVAEAGVTTDGWSDDVASAARRALRILTDGDLPADLDIHSRWRNPMHVSTAQAADAGSKILATVPWLAETSVGLEVMGLTPDQAARAASERSRSAGQSVLDRLTGAADASNGG